MWTNNPTLPTRRTHSTTRTSTITTSTACSSSRRLPSRPHPLSRRNSKPTTTEAWVPTVSLRNSARPSLRATAATTTNLALGRWWVAHDMYVCIAIHDMQPRTPRRHRSAKYIFKNLVSVVLRCLNYDRDVTRGRKTALSLSLSPFSCLRACCVLNLSATVTLDQIRSDQINKPTSLSAASRRVCDVPL